MKERAVEEPLPLFSGASSSQSQGKCEWARQPGRKERIRGYSKKRAPLPLIFSPRLSPSLRPRVLLTCARPCTCALPLVIDQLAPARTKNGEPTDGQPLRQVRARHMHAVVRALARLRARTTALLETARDDASLSLSQIVNIRKVEVVIIIYAWF